MNDSTLFNLEALIDDLKKGTTERKEPQNVESLMSHLTVEQVEHLHALCTSKAEEFALIGYDNISKDDIWHFFEQKYEAGFPSLHRIVNDILSLKVTAFMNTQTINAYKGV